ncbi:MAG: heme-binding protein [Pseudomonadota bacterium]
MLTSSQTDTIISQAFAHGVSEGLAPLCVAIIDAGGHLLALRRDHRASIGRPQIALGKAAGCLSLGVGGRTLAKMAADRPRFVDSLSSVLPNGCVPVPGGVLIRDDSGTILGAVGVTGDVSEKDEACAVAGLQAAGLVPDTGAA